MQVFRMLPEGTLAEVIDNTLVMSPAPSPLHQEVSMKLTMALYNFISQNEIGKLFAAPIDVFLDEHSNAVQPDIVFVSNDNKLVIDETGLHGIPDLIVEILSRSNPKHDLVKKKKLYERFGIGEYWVVDPQTRVATGFKMSTGGYQIIGEYTREISSPFFSQHFTF